MKTEMAITTRYVEKGVELTKTERSCFFTNGQVRHDNPTFSLCIDDDIYDISMADLESLSVLITQALNNG